MRLDSRHGMISRPMPGLAQDLRYGARSLVKARGFTVVAVLTLALGVGANAAMFSVVNAVMLRPLPYKDADRLAMLWTADPGRGIHEEGTSYLTVAEWRSQSRAFADFAICSRGNPVTLTGAPEPERVMSELVSANLFGLLGVEPLLGRTFSEDEEQRRERLVVLSFAFWQRRFGASPDAIGKNVEIDGERVRVIGVMPEGFYFPTKDVQFWQPATLVGLSLKTSVRDGIWAGRFNDWWRVVGRLEPGATYQEAQAEMTAIGERLAQAYPTTDSGFAGFGVNVVPILVQATGRNLQLALWVLLGAVAFVLLIACANIANLLLARAAAREREFALRSALGAGQWRLMRQIAIESAMLAAAGGIVGLMLADAAVQILMAAAPPGIPRLDEIEIDKGVLLFAAVVSIAGGLLFGFVPAWRVSRSDPGDALKDGGRGFSQGLRLSRARRTFVVVECALAVALLAGAGLLMKSFIRLQAVTPGFDAERVLMVRVTTPMLRDVIERAAGLPGVQTAGAIEYFDPRNPDQPITAEGRPAIRASLTAERVSPGFFRAMGVPLGGGRELTVQDGPDAALINQTMARTFWPGEDPIGKRFKRGDSQSTSRWMTVTGVVGDMRRRGLERDVVSEFFVPELQPTMDVVIRTTADPLALVASVRGVIRASDRHAVIARVTTVESHMGALGAERRFQTWLIMVFAGLALLLSAIGIYGVMHSAVVQRTREMGIRLAFGARAPDVLWLVIGDGLRLTAAGVGAGLVTAVALSRIVAHLLFDVSATDPVVFAGVSMALALVAALACYLPARRASRIDPVVTLRDE